MLILLLIYLISSAVTIRRDKSVLFSRIIIKSLLFVVLLANNNIYIRQIKSIKLAMLLNNYIIICFSVINFTLLFNIFIFSLSTCAIKLLLIGNAIYLGLVVIAICIVLFIKELYLVLGKKIINIELNILLFLSKLVYLYYTIFNINLDITYSIIVSILISIIIYTFVSLTKKLNIYINQLKGLILFFISEKLCNVVSVFSLNLFKLW